MKQNLLTINEFAKLCRSTPRTLRLYEQLGLLQPVERDKWNKYRLYDPSQGRLFFKIKLLQNFHVPLGEIVTILKDESVQEYLSEKITALHREIDEKQKEYTFLKKFKKFYFENVDLNQVLKREEIGPYFIFGKTLEQEHYHQLTPDLENISSVADELKLKRTRLTITHYLESEKYKPLNTKIEISVIVRASKLPPEKILPEGYFLKKFPKTQVYVYKYVGPYEFITLVYEQLHELEITKKLPVLFQPLDITFDDFLSAKKSTYDLTTKICFPIRQ